MGREPGRRAEAWLVVYLMVSGHFLPRVGGAGMRHRMNAQRGEAMERTRDGRAVAVAACHNDSDGNESNARGARGSVQRSALKMKVDNVAGVEWWSHAVRVGEAGNPGPTALSLAVDGALRKIYSTARAAVTYPCPGTGSLRGAVAPGYETAAGDQGRDDQFALAVEAANTTGWKGLQRRLAASGAHALLAQETWVTQDAIPAASAWALRRGWKSVWTAAKPGPNGGGLRRHCYFCPRLPRPEVPPWRDTRMVPWQSCRGHPRCPVPQTDAPRFMLPRAWHWTCAGKPGAAGRYRREAPGDEMRP